MLTATNSINIFIGERFACSRQQILYIYLLETVSSAHGDPFYEHNYWRTFRVHASTHFMNLFLGEVFMCTGRHIL